MEGELAAASVERESEDVEHVGGEVDDEAMRQDRAMEKEERLTLLAGDLPEVMLSWRGEVPWWRKEAGGEGDREGDEEDKEERKIRGVGAASGMRPERADPQGTAISEEKLRGMNSVEGIAS